MTNLHLGQRVRWNSEDYSFDVVPLATIIALRRRFPHSPELSLDFCLLMFDKAFPEKPILKKIHELWVSVENVEVVND